MSDDNAEKAWREYRDYLADVTFAPSYRDCFMAAWHARDAEVAELKAELTAERTRADKAEASLTNLAAGFKSFMRSHNRVLDENARLREVIELVHGLLSDLDLDSGKTTAPGTAWGSILREARALAAVPVEPQGDHEGGA